MFASVLLAASVVALAPPQEIQRSIDAFVAPEPGVVVAVGVVDRGKTTTYFAGKPPSDAPKFDANAEFQIGSISKTFTSTILAELSLRGIVKLDDPISKYLPANVKAPSYHGEQITLLNLAEQNSGLPYMPTNFTETNPTDPFADYDQAKLYAFLDTYQLPRAPGAKFEYSNLGVGLLGQLLANAARTTYPKLLQRYVLLPLGMHDTSAELLPAISARMMPGVGPTAERANPWTITSLAGAGAINSTLNDMLRYLKANVNAPAGPLGKAMALAHQPRTDGPPMQKIGLNWIVSPSGLVWHNGETGGYSAFLAFSQKDGVGIVVLTNVATGTNLTDALAAHLIESQRYPSAPVLAGPVVPHGNSPYVGLYQLSPTFKIVVYEENGVLYGQATQQSPFVLTLQSGTTYKVEGVNASITFNKDAAGKIVSLVLHQNGLDQTALRMHR